MPVYVGSAVKLRPNSTTFAAVCSRVLVRSPALIVPVPAVVQRCRPTSFTVAPDEFCKTRTVDTTRIPPVPAGTVTRRYVVAGVVGTFAVVKL